MAEEKRSLILPVTKSPWSRGRIGPKEKQDWYQGLTKAVRLSKEIHDSRILVLSGFQKTGEEAEADIYLSTLKELGFDESKILVVREENETVGQIDRALKIAEEEKANLITVSTLLHAPRISWLLRGKEVTQYVVWGIPRPREALTDLALMVLFPVIDIAGGRAWFQNKVAGRRKEKKF